MKYIDFITDSKDKQDIIKELVKLLESEYAVSVKINNIIGSIVYISVKKNRDSTSSDTEIKVRVTEAFSVSRKEIKVLIVDA